MSDQEYIEALNHTQGIVVKHIAHLDERIAELEAENAKLSKAITVADINLPCMTHQCQLEVKAALAAALLEEK